MSPLRLSVSGRRNTGWSSDRAPVPNLGSKMGLDATRKLPGKTSRAWSQPIVADAAVARRAEAIWQRATEI